MRYLIICSLSLLSPYLALADETHIEQARQTLKNYGLGHCILKPFNERSALEKTLRCPPMPIHSWATAYIPSCKMKTRCKCCTIPIKKH